MECYWISQIVCFAYVLFIAASALYDVDNIFRLTGHMSLTLKTFSLKSIDDPSIRCLHRLHLGSLQVLTLYSSLKLLVNLAFVNKRFKFGGSHLLLTKTLSLKLLCSSSFLCKIDLSCFMSGLYGLNVVTYGMISNSSDFSWLLINVFSV